jgi:L-aminopeptidase/D-esterase-like protein
VKIAAEGGPRGDAMGSITDVAGVRVGHAQNPEARTGCTVILPPPGTMAGIALRGCAPATRELDLVRIDGITREVHAILLTGGSVFGLDAASGVVRWLAEREVGFDAGVARVPLVPTVALFDLAWGRADVRPDAAMGSLACAGANAKPMPEGAVGAGCGATVGKILGMAHCCQSGIGSASTRLRDITIGAVAVSNAFGDLRDATGRIVAGARAAGSQAFLDTSAVLKTGKAELSTFAGNCSFAVVALDMALDRPGANRLAESAMAGMTRAISPAHTLFDFDVVFVLSCGERRGDSLAVGEAAAALVHEAILRGAKAGSAAD